MLAGCELVTVGAKDSEPSPVCSRWIANLLGESLSIGSGMFDASCIGGGRHVLQVLVSICSAADTAPRRRIATITAQQADDRRGTNATAIAEFTRDVHA